jgi:hypothetical protein
MSDIKAKDAVIWVNKETREVMVRPHRWGVPEDYAPFKRGHWGDPIGAAYSQWWNMSNDQRVRLMLETAVDLAMQDIPMPTVLQAFAEVEEFRALGSESYPMCRALTKAMLGRSLEPNTMSFEELLVQYRHRAT